MIRALTVILKTICLSSLMDRDEFRCKKVHFYPSLISNALCLSVDISNYHSQDSEVNRLLRLLSDLIKCIKWLFIRIKFAVKAMSVMLR